MTARPDTSVETAAGRRPNVGIDAGQSTIRIRVDGEPIGRTVDGLSHPIAASDFVDRVAGALSGTGTTGLGRVVVGMTTLPAGPEERADLAELLHARLGADEAWLTGDEIAAHAGAFDGDAGVVLVVGTGVACVAADPVAGSAHHVDGAGYLLGDEGGGFWIGRHAIRAALAAAEGRRPSTRLRELVADRFDGLDGLAARLHAEPDAVDRIAHAAVDVLAAADVGDQVAVDLLGIAAERLAETVATAAERLAETTEAATGPFAGQPAIAVDGRLLAGDSPLAEHLHSRLRARFGDGVRVDHRPGSALRGALTLASGPVDASPYRRWMTPAAAPDRHRIAPPPAAARLLDASRRVLDDIRADELDAIERAAAHLADTIAAGGLVHVFGTGHSHLLAEELFYRAGGLAAINPILEPSLMLHQGAIRSTELERTSGIADGLLADVESAPIDSLIVASNSGGNVVTDELAERCRAVGMTVVAVISRAHAATKPAARLIELADVVIDNHGVVGDASIDVDGLDTPVAPTSTIAGAAIVQALAAATIEQLLARDVDPAVLRSANTPGGDAHNERVLAPFRDRIRALRHETPGV